DDGLQAHPADGLDVPRLADPDDDRREDQRDDEHLDQVDEGPRHEAERLVGVGVLLRGKEVTEDHAEDERIEDEGRRRQPGGPIGSGHRRESVSETACRAAARAVPAACISKLSLLIGSWLTSYVSRSASL